MRQLLLSFISHDHPTFSSTAPTYCTIGQLDLRTHMLFCKLPLFVPSPSVTYLPLYDKGIKDCWFVVNEVGEEFEIILANLECKHRHPRVQHKVACSTGVSRIKKAVEQEAVLQTVNGWRTGLRPRNFVLLRAVGYIRVENSVYTPVMNGTDAAVEVRQHMLAVNLRPFSCFLESGILDRDGLPLRYVIHAPTGADYSFQFSM